MNRGLTKKVAAIVMSMVIAFGAVSVLPSNAVKDNAIVASAAQETEINDCIFKFSFTERTGEKTIVIEDVTIQNDEGRVEIPSTITVDGVQYDVTEIGESFLERSYVVKTAIIPDCVTRIDALAFWNSSLENLVLSNNVEEIGYGFCAGCDKLKLENVKYSGTKIKKLSTLIFGFNPAMANDKGAVCLGNWLLKYTPDESVTSVKIAELGNGGVKIDHIAGEAFVACDNITSIDFEGVEEISKDVLKSWPNLTDFQNTESIVKLGNYSLEGTDWMKELEGTKWYENAQNSNNIKFGSILFHYMTDGYKLDFTEGELAGTKVVRKGALVDCPNVATLILTSDCTLEHGCFYSPKYTDPPKFYDPMPSNSTSRIANITLDGKILGFSKMTPVMPEWVSKNFAALDGSEWVKGNAETKMNALIKQLDMPYFISPDDKTQELSATTEFYNILKAYEYVSTYELDNDNEYINVIDAFLNGGKLNAEEYSTLMHYMLERSGVECRTIVSLSHQWNSARIGDEWFESDAAMDIQNGYGWFALSVSRLDEMDNINASSTHEYDSALNQWHDFTGAYLYSSRPKADRILGDINGDDVRDQKDVTLLWSYLNGEGSIDQKLGDINFDNVVDITDAVLLDAFVNHTSLDPQEYSADTLTQGFNVAFVNGTDYESINYARTDEDGYFELPADVMYETPKGKKFDGWNLGKAGERIKITNPYTVIQPVWVDDVKWQLGDVDGNNTIDIADVSMLINHINGVKSLDDEAMLRADVNKSNSVDISDASTIVNHINGVKALEGMV